MNRFVATIVLLVTAFTFGMQALAQPPAAESDDAAVVSHAYPLASASVKPLRAPQVTEPEPMNAGMAIPNARPATLPAERLPQYQMYHRKQLAEKFGCDGEIQFVLTNPILLRRTGRPLRVRARVTIDGIPYVEVRDARVTSLRTPTTDKANTDKANPIEQPTIDQEIQPSVDADATADKSTDSERNEAPPVTPATIEAYMMANNPAETMRRFAEAIGEAPAHEEAKWLLNHWTDGPSLLLVHPYFQSFRSDQRPAFTVLDRDRDGIISKDELSQAVDSFLRCDANRDEVVNVLEIASAADSVQDSATITHHPGPLLWLLTDLVGINEADPLLYSPVSSLDTDQDGTIEEAEIAAICEQPSDIELSIEFHPNSSKTSRLDVLRVADDLGAQVKLSTPAIGIDIMLGSLNLHFCGVQEPDLLSKIKSNSGQISLGALVDGYPLLPLLDPNDDGRFTIRELRELTSRLKSFDLNGDNSLSHDETHSPIRVCIGLGATAHLELTGVRTHHRPAPISQTTIPDWFIRTDRNKDNDLSRSEFPGSDEQFQSLDSDGDNLISADEANQYEQAADK